MINGSNPVGQPRIVAGASPYGPSTGIGWNTQPQPAQPGMTVDQYAQNSMGPGAGYPLSILANDYRRPVDYTALRIQQRLQSLGVNTTGDLLRRADTPLKRDMLIRACSLFDSQVTNDKAKQYIQGWLGISDLCRTGMQPDTARLLQTSGIFDSPSLSRYFAPMDKAALYGTLTTNAVRFGYRLPTWNEFSNSIDVARTLPYAVRW